MKNYIKYLCAVLLVIGTSAHVWGTETLEAAFIGNYVIKTSTYQEQENSDWYLSLGGSGNGYSDGARTGFNGKYSGTKTIGNSFGTSATTTHHGYYIKNKNTLSNICKITFTYTHVSTASECAQAKIYLGYSTNGSTWNALSLKTGSQGQSVAPSGWDGVASSADNSTVWEFEFTPIASAYYAVIISRNGSVTSGEGFGFANTVVNFYSGCCEELDKPTGLTVTQNVGGNHGKTTWSWNSVTHADSYVLSITKNETTTNTYSVASTSKTGTISAPGNYTWSVSAVGSDPYCEDNPAQDGTPFCIGADLTAVTPSGLSATPTSTSAATISWSSVSGAEYYEVEVKVDGGATVTSDIVDGTSWNATGLSPNTTYRVFWKAVNICDDAYNSAVNSSYTFTITTHTVQFNLNGKGSGKPSNQTVLHGGKATTPTPPTAPEGWSFGGWYKESGCTNAWNFGSDVVNADVTLYAKWVEKRTLTVASVSYVTISATSPSVAEGSSAYVAPGATVTLTHDTPTSPYQWAGWNVYKTGDASTKVTVTTNTFTMPDYNVTVSAFLYGDLRAFCEPEVEITLTQTDGGSDPLLITSGYGLGTSSVDASRTLRITVANATGSAVVNLSGTNLRFFKTNGSRTEIGASNLTCTAGALSTDIIVAYAPTSYTDDNIATPSITVTCEGTSKTFNNLVKARCLPEHFVIAAKINGRWCALPADLATSASPAPTLPAAYPISVDNEDAPRVAKVAPKTAIYGFSARNAVTSHTGGIRLDTKTGSSDGHLQAPRSNDLTYLWRPSTNASTGMQDWYLTSKGSSDANFYTYYIGVDPACTLADGTTPISRYLCIYGDKIMWTSSADETHRRFRILPIEKEVEPLDEIQVVEWASDKIRFMYLGNPLYKACVEIGGVLKSAAAAVLGTSLKIDEGVYEIAVSDLMSNAYKQLYIVIKNGDTEVGRQAVTIPLMVNTTTTVATAASGFTKTIQCPKMDLIVLSGGKLTADDATAYQFKSVSVYGGGKLIVDASKGLNAGNMYLRAGTITATPGSTPVTSYNYVYPQVYIGSGATLSTTGNVIYFDYLTNYEQYFGLALPYPVTINATTDIFYPSDIYGAQAKRGSFLLRVFDSKIRAAQGAVDAVWVDVESGSEGSGGSVAVQSTTERGLGYTMLGVPLKVSINGGSKVRQKYGIHRMKMDITSASDLATSENSNASISVTAHSAGQIYNTGWWLLGNPYMADLSAGVSGASITVGSIGTNAEGQYEWQNKSIRYVTVPDDAGGATYDQRPISEYTFPAFKPFYVQVGSTGSVTFAYGSRSAAAPRRFRSEEMPAEIETSIALNSTEFGDTTHLLIGDAFSDEYEIGDDLMKMPHANVSLFTITGGQELFANALNAQSASAGIPVGYTAPSAGTYVFSWNDKVNSTWIQHLWLTDLDLSTQTDLLVDSYEFETEAGTNKTRFVLVVELKKKTDVTTDIDDVRGESDKPLKFIYHNKMYILRNGVIYDATGKRVQTINK